MRASGQRRGGYMVGPEVQAIEAELGKFCGVQHVLSCANGTGALQLVLMALEMKPGDAVFCPSFTFAATAEIIPTLGGTLCFVDVREDSFNVSLESLRRTIELAERSGDRPAGIIVVTRLEADGVSPIVSCPRPLHRQNARSAYPHGLRSLPGAELLAACVVFGPPMHPHLDQADQDQVIDSGIQGLAA